MTAQSPEWLKYHGQDYFIYEYPLDPLIKQETELQVAIRNPLRFSYTSCLRGYSGHWEINNNVLFLKNNPVSEWITTKKFPLIATWYTGEITIPGDLTNPKEPVYPTYDILSMVPTSQRRLPDFYTVFEVKEGVILSMRKETAEEEAIRSEKKYAKIKEEFYEKRNKEKESKNRWWSFLKTLFK